MTKALRTKSLTVRLTDTEYAYWESLAEAAGLGNNLSKFVRYCVSQKPLPPPLPEINSDIYWELSKIGVNLNQMVKAMNTAVKQNQGVSVDTRPELEQLLTLIRELNLQLLGITES